jgi:hypothetical protein
VEYLHPYSVFSPSINWASTTRYRYGNTQTTAMIPNVGIPWFMLGVIYVGLFFLLADKKEVRP